MERKERKRLAKEKRKLLRGLGQAKAVDRGQWQHTYLPGGKLGDSFEAKSGLPNRTKLFTVLGIESSCDDTGAAVVRSDGKILGESLASQNEIHEEWGGVVPGLARDAHIAKLDGVNIIDDDVDAIGVTVGPGLEICLRVGCNRARELAMQYNKPFVGVHHLEAHILMARLPDEASLSENEELVNVPATNDTHESQRTVGFPFMALLVSGGHCQILKCLGIGRYSILGGTLDDSLGEAFDKTARLLGLPVGGGGGPAVERLAREGDPNSVTLPLPLARRQSSDLSYAGLKTAVRLAVEKMQIEQDVEELDHNSKADVAASFQNMAIKHIEKKLGRAMAMVEDEGIKNLAVVGGVAANTELRSRIDTMCKDRGWRMFVPPPRLCTDQGSMSAWAAIERLMMGSSDSAEDQDVFARYPFGQIDLSNDTEIK
eukprot:CAMPEP_0118674756 /NCGR_PEP_ID=MMETSP0800-20121206/1064_1 /TAXON_ID=210618 ORGANISM="Striatella unipunctata, Strain CCMP2910" /NCGR_SAMPLE_ID=MMETSP0800 /ASSEMBLY_ACC=CAM_ASM_000638 /LENGTH=428 /DNA_ID=CAMNT_0006569985 /DNA_START=115 /DNA_END=1402 /DNA_ORIENTATION=+